MIRILHATLLASPAVFGVSVLLHAQPPSASSTWRIADVPADLKPAIERADIYITAQHSALLRQLTQAVSRGGVALAIESCHLDATSQAYWVGRQHGYAIGRTSDRLRSPTNAPRPWAAAIIRDYAGKQAADVDGFALDLGERIGVLRPIAMRPVCASCHAAPERISAQVKDVLTDRYPRDRAVGFASGEIRGWYWMEIPKPARTGR
ncbi:MAG: DUF3365 domain-containing protein [Acidobacteriota bacterium]